MNTGQVIGLLRGVIGMTHAASRRLTDHDGRLQRRDRESHIDRSADRITNHAARSGLGDRCQIDGADRHRDVCHVSDPELVGSIQRHVVDEIGEDRFIVITVRGDDKPAPSLRLEAMLAHEPAIFFEFAKTPWWRSAAPTRRSQ